MWPGTRGGLRVTQEVGEVGCRPRGAQRAKVRVMPGDVGETGAGRRQQGSQWRAVAKVRARDRAGLGLDPPGCGRGQDRASQRQSRQPGGRTGGMRG